MNLKSKKRHKIFIASCFVLLLILPSLVPKNMPEDARISGIFRNRLSPKQAHPALNNLAPQMLWAWQRPEDLRDLPSHIGIAYVATTIVVEGQTTNITPRRHALLISPITPRVPVVHVDISLSESPSLSAQQRDTIVDALLAAVEFSNTNVVQLDFEVRRSQREFLRDVVIAARKKLPPDVALSMTALASWCAGDDWLADIPADEVVPMAFRMAAGDTAIRALLSKYGRFQPLHCQSAIGTATDEPLQDLPASSPLRSKTTRFDVNFATSKNFRHYRFSPKSWTSAQWQ